ncbi:hypothetical protein MMPV_006676 [Pyropia vietnamensis]
MGRDPEFHPANVMTILLATDNHLGYMEKHPVRGDDSFRAFAEILQIARANAVDALLLGGDLFHENKPSRATTLRTMDLLREATLGDTPPVALACRSNAAAAFGTPTVNYMNPYVHVSLPVFVIHGNHDDPTGTGGAGGGDVGGVGSAPLSALDILQAACLVNYFGRVTDAKRISLAPVLLEKGVTRTALYGLGNVRDERLYTTWSLEKNLTWVAPAAGEAPLVRQRGRQGGGRSPAAAADGDGDGDGDGGNGDGDDDGNGGAPPTANVAPADDWFNLFVLHQNRVTRGSSKSISVDMLPSWLHFVLWGHEHDSYPEPVGEAPAVCQPGSSVATSLSAGEARPKHVVLLRMFKTQHQVVSIPLQTVREFVTEDVTLSSELPGGDPEDTSRVSELLKGRVSAAAAAAAARFDKKKESYAVRQGEAPDGGALPPRARRHRRRRGGDADGDIDDDREGDEGAAIAGHGAGSSEHGAVAPADAGDDEYQQVDDYFLPSRAWYRRALVARLRLPLVRLRVEYSGGFATLSTHRFGQPFVKSVANPGDILHFFRRRTVGVRRGVLRGMVGGAADVADGSADAMEEALEEAESAFAVRAGGNGSGGTSKRDTLQVPELVHHYLVKGRGLEMLHLDELNDAVDQFVDKNETKAIPDHVDGFLATTRKALAQQQAASAAPLGGEEVARILAEDAKKALIAAEANLPAVKATPSTSGVSGVATASADATAGRGTGDAGATTGGGGGARGAHSRLAHIDAMLAEFPQLRVNPADADGPDNGLPDERVASSSDDDDLDTVTGAGPGAATRAGRGRGQGRDRGRGRAAAAAAKPPTAAAVRRAAAAAASAAAASSAAAAAASTAPAPAPRRITRARAPAAMVIDDDDDDEEEEAPNDEDDVYVPDWPPPPHSRSTRARGGKGAPSAAAATPPPRSRGRSTAAVAPAAAAASASQASFGLVSRRRPGAVGHKRKADALGAGGSVAATPPPPVSGRGGEGRSAAPASTVYDLDDDDEDDNGM